jgi:two-component system, OmpR family, heavy metal sensor histidine kinase CusS
MMQPIHSIARQLSLRLLVLTLAVLGLVCAGIYAATWALHQRAQERVLILKINKLTETAQSLLSAQDDRFFKLLAANAQKRPGTRLALWHADGRVFYRDPSEEPHFLSVHQKSRRFTLPYAGESVLATPPLVGEFAIDVEADMLIMRSIAGVLILATVLGAMAASASALLAVRYGLKPLAALTLQTQQISTDRLGQRLHLATPVAELQPWMDQFNQLMDRVESTYRQLESFNADVAHELRTPLTALVGKTEVALTRDRPACELADTLHTNLQALQRMSQLINDMLFLSRADRGAVARCGEPVALGTLAMQVLEFYEALLADKHLTVQVQGDCVLAVDEPLVKRALANLLANAARFASAHSTLTVRVVAASSGAQLSVVNAGQAVASAHLPHLFDRFYRADPARGNSDNHHGLGLAIVAAIARMHGGQTFARSDSGQTEIGFSLGTTHSQRFANT